MSISTETEVLGPPLTKSEARAEINDARRYYRRATRSILMFCAHLRKLQDGGAHITYGYSSFGEFAMAEISPELSKNAIERFSWQGSVLLVLERSGRLSLEGRTLPVGTTGARALATVLTQQGEGKMVEVFDLAQALKPGPLSDATVARARRELDPPRPKKALEETSGETQFTVGDYPNDTDPYDPAQLPGDLEQTRLALDELIDDLIHTEVEESDRHASLRELTAIRTRVDRLAEALRG